ncbi:hypothetical protein [Shewanella woodyi]|uniref:hypothetical protein n=1 Tax=Shewanella woodyi TaxID=60961 RepID=UPI003748CB11
MIELEFVNQALNFPSKSTSEHKDNNRLFVTQLNSKLQNKGELSNNRFDGNKTVGVLPDTVTLTTELLNQRQESTDAASSMLPSVLYGEKLTSTQPRFASQSGEIKFTPNWLSVGSYQVQTLNIEDITSELTFGVSSKDIFNKNLNLSYYFQNIFSGFESVSVTNIAVSGKNVGASVASHRQQESHKSVEVSGINASFWKSLEHSSVRRLTVTEFLGVRTARVRDYFTEDINLEYTTVFENLNIDRLIVNGNLHWERK